LTELNHMSYNNLTFESDRKTLRHDSYRRGRLGIKEMPMYNGFRGSRGESIRNTENVPVPSNRCELYD